MVVLRVSRATGEVVNVESVTEEWLTANSGDPDYEFRPVVEASTLPVEATDE